MSIRELYFEEGESLNIRECVKLQTNISVEELQELAEKEDVLIVKSGKSYFNVTERPEIFEQARDFDINSLTKIDKREMQPKDVVPAFNELKHLDPMALLYQNTAVEEETEEYEEVERKTYYLRLDQIEALKILCFKEGKEVSEMVRELLDAAINLKSDEHGTDYHAEAEKRLQAQPRTPKKRRKRKIK